MFILELIFDWILDPLMDMLQGRRISGKWRLSYLFPVITALGGILWWLGSHFEIVLLLVFGVLITVLFGLFSIVTWIPREVQSWKDIKSHVSKDASKVEKADEKSQET